MKQKDCSHRWPLWQPSMPAAGQPCCLMVPLSTGHGLLTGGPRPEHGQPRTGPYASTRPHTAQGKWGTNGDLMWTVNSEGKMMRGSTKACLHRTRATTNFLMFSMNLSFFTNRLAHERFDWRPFSICTRTSVHMLCKAACDYQGLKTLGTPVTMVA
eukprot:1159528-Pelagomonas_calceolata.AAC.1